MPLRPIDSGRSKPKVVFPKGCPLGEDTYVAGKLLLSGHSLRYEAQAGVYHSHHYNAIQDFQRMFDTGVFHAQNPWLRDEFGTAEGEGLRLARSQFEFLKSKVQTPTGSNWPVPNGYPQLAQINRLPLGLAPPPVAHAPQACVCHAQALLDRKCTAPAGMIPTLSLFQVRVSKFAILLGDAIAFACAFAVATLINVMADPSKSASVWFSTQDVQRYVAWAGLVFLGLMLFLMRFQHYSDRRPFWDELGDILRLTSSLALLDMTLIASTRWNSSRLWWLLVWLIAVVMIVWGRMLTRMLLKQFGLWTRPTIIIGQGPNANDAAVALQSEPRMGFQVAGYVDVTQAQPELKLNGRTLKNSAELQVLADQPGIQWVIALEHSQSDQREHWLRTLAQWGATDISVIPAMRGVPLYGTDMSHFFSHEVALLRVRNNLTRWPARLTKRLFDLSSAAFLLLVLSPLMLIIALRLKARRRPCLVCAHSRWKKWQGLPVLQVSLHGAQRRRQIAKLLQHNPALKAEWDKEHKLKDDPRISKLGAFLGATAWMNCLNCSTCSKAK